jgi:hypothetical protein
MRWTIYEIVFECVLVHSFDAVDFILALVR